MQAFLIILGLLSGLVAGGTLVFTRTMFDVIAGLLLLLIMTAACGLGGVIATLEKGQRAEAARHAKLPKAA